MQAHGAAAANALPLEEIHTLADPNASGYEKVEAVETGALKVLFLGEIVKGGAKVVKEGRTSRAEAAPAKGTAAPGADYSSHGGEFEGEGLRMKDQPLEGGPYTGIVPDPKNVTVAGEFKDAAQRKAIFEANRRRNGGVLRSDLSGVELEKGQKSKKGVKPSPREAQIDHAKAAAKGGTNRSSNALVLSREENRAKSDKDFGQQ